MQYHFYHYNKLILLFFFVTTHIFTAEISSSQEALKITQKQQIYLFSILKESLMVVMQSDYKNPQKSKKVAIQNFEEGSHKLSHYLKENTLKKIEGKFILFKKKLSQPFNKNNGINYFSDALFIEKSIKKYSFILNNHSKQKLSKTIQSKYTLGVLSQKINTLYLLKTLGVSKEIINPKMHKMMLTFKTSLQDIKNHRKIHKRLKKIYNFFQVMNSFDNYVPIMVTKKSNKMLNYANTLK